MDIIKYTWISSYGQMAGFAMELVLLSFALANQINRERIAREEAQQMTLMLTKRISKELEQRVQERTIDLKNAMLRLKKVNKELSELTITDPLTKVYNRRFFDKALANEVKRANRTLQPIAVVMVDIDHFKMINDNHGHPVGDKCLFLVAQALRQQTSRSGDLVARYGGEEFILILTATSEEKALLLAEKVRDAVEKLVINNNGNPIQLRVSVGVAAWVPRQGESHHQLVKAADNALYQAKRNGRNQVVAISA
jgi:diguanylate cyclase (GGDEF)-like protein